MVQMRWVPIPNRLDGDGYTELISHPRGPAHLGAWCSLLAVASRCGIRGTLLRDGGQPHDALSLERITRIPVSVWEEALPRLINIGWITGCDVPQEGDAHPAPIPHPSAMNGRKEGMEGREWKEGKEGITLSGANAPDAVSALLEQQRTEVEAIPYSKIVDLLNSAASTRYNPKTDATRRFIKARWNEGYRLPDFERVIQSKCAQWKRDPKMVSYLRPQTLFGTKFEAYLNESSIAAASIPCPDCGLRDGHKYDCPRSTTAAYERVET
jgi:uncharacterized phage protein (TIGR02220 family)